MIRHQFNRRAVGADDVHIKVNSFALCVLFLVLSVLLSHFFCVRVNNNNLSERMRTTLSILFENHVLTTLSSSSIVESFH
jgi:hypothetical protein